MPNYKNSKIYCIHCNKTGLNYIGSTVSEIKQRIAGHICQCKKGNTASSSIIIKNGDYTVSILEEYPCDTEEQLLERESFYINLTQNCVNTKCPVIDKDKFSHENYGAAYLKEYGKLTMICECGEEIKKRNRSVHIKSIKHFEKMKTMEVEHTKEKDKPNSEIMSKMLNILNNTNNCSFTKMDEITDILEQMHETIYLLEKMRENSAHLSIPPASNHL